MRRVTARNVDISMNGQMLEEVTSFNYFGATLCKDVTCSAEIRISDGKIEQDLAKQYYQICNQVEAVQASCHPHPPLWH